MASCSNLVCGLNINCYATGLEQSLQDFDIRANLDFTSSAGNYNTQCAYVPCVSSFAIVDILHPQKRPGCEGG